MGRLDHVCVRPAIQSFDINERRFFAIARGREGGRGGEGGEGREGTKGRERREGKGGEGGEEER